MLVLSSMIWGEYCVRRGLQRTAVSKHIVPEILVLVSGYYRPPCSRADSLAWWWDFSGGKRENPEEIVIVGFKVSSTWNKGNH